MSNNMIKALGLIVMVVSATACSSASATTWTTNGPLNFTATGGSTLVLIHVPAGSHAAHNVGISCAGSGATGTVNAGGVGNPFAVASVTPSFTMCSQGITSGTFRCSPATLQATGYASGRTSGYLASVSCTFTVSTCVITIQSNGTSGHGLDVTYTNSGGVFDVDAVTTTQTLTASWPSTTQCNNIFLTTAAGDQRSGAVNLSTLPSGDVLLRTTSSPLPNIVGV